MEIVRHTIIAILLSAILLPLGAMAQNEIAPYPVYRVSDGVHIVGSRKSMAYSQPSDS